jgi:hypothetical protein
MKTIALILLGAGLLQQPASAQQPVPPVSRHPMISVHNYKHADKAAQARREQAGRGGAVAAPAPGQTNLANYKRQGVPTRPAGGLTVPHTPDTVLANRNYKQTRPTPAVTNPTETAIRNAGPQPEKNTGSGN